MRRVLAVLFLGLLSGAALGAQTVEVWKTESCGCCGKWIEHLQAAGFRVSTRNVADLDAARARNGVPRTLGSCHTARVGGYAIEGHVPAACRTTCCSSIPGAAREFTRATELFRAGA